MKKFSLAARAAVLGVCGIGVVVMSAMPAHAATVVSTKGVTLRNGAPFKGSTNVRPVNGRICVTVKHAGPMGSKSTVSIAATTNGPSWVYATTFTTLTANKKRTQYSGCMTGLAKYRLSGAVVSTTSGSPIGVFNVAYRFDSPSATTRSATFDITVTN